MDEAALNILAHVVLPLRCPAATCRNSTSCLCRTVYFKIPLFLCSSASGTLGLRPRKGAAGCFDQGVIDDRVLLHGHAVDLEVGFVYLKDLLAEIALYMQMSECQSRGLLRESIANHVVPIETVYCRHLDQRIFHRGIAEVEPMQQMVVSRLVFSG